MSAREPEGSLNHFAATAFLTPEGSASHTRVCAQEFLSQGFGLATHRQGSENLTPWLRSESGRDATATAIVDDDVARGAGTGREVSSDLGLELDEGQPTL